MKTITLRIYLEANVYAEQGWDLNLVPIRVGDEELYDYKKTNERCVLITEVEIPHPPAEAIIRVCDAQTEKLRDQIAKAEIEAREQLAKYISKYTLLTQES